MDCYSKMHVNVEKFHVIWFSVKSSKPPLYTVPPILLKGTPLVNVSKQKYLGITNDGNLTWAYHVANVCKKMAYYLFRSTVIRRYLLTILLTC